MPLKHTWLPCDYADSQDKLKIIGSQGSYIVSDKYGKLYDAISSWWCKPLGHKHPLVLEALQQQLTKFEHHIPANTYNEVIEELSSYLINIFSQMDKVIYASDGSSAVEIALKLSYETRVLNNQAARNKFIALNGAYHGETIFTLGVCGIDTYKKNYQQLIQTNYFLSPLCYVTNTDDPLWHKANFDELYWHSQFSQYATTASALIIEPLVQGANGMKIISADFLKRLINLAKKYDLHIIADEIMVGLGRLGVFSVSHELLNIEADLVCFAKNLSAGSIPMSAVVVNKSISNVFRHHKQIFPHSHTHSCNVLGASVALAYLKYLHTSDLLNQVKFNAPKLLQVVTSLCTKHSFLTKPRAIGAIAAFELNLPKEILTIFFTHALHAGLYLRPIGRVCYLMPPLYNLTDDIKIINAKLELLCTQIEKLNA